MPKTKLEAGLYSDAVSYTHLDVYKRQDGNNPLTPDNVLQNPSDTDKKEDAEPVKADTVNSQEVKTQAVQTSDENSYFLPVTVSGIAMGLGVVLVYVKRRITARR